MILHAVGMASAHLSETALDELNAPAGLPLGGARGCAASSFLYQPAPQRERYLCGT